MAISLADQYYLKALDDYYYNFEQVVENLGYALSYDPEHSGANYLMGRMHMEIIHDLNRAEEYFIISMATDPRNAITCIFYGRLMIKMGKLKEALNLIEYSKKLKGVDQSEFLQLEALVYEIQKRYDKAKVVLNEAIQESYNDVKIGKLKVIKKRIVKKKQSMKKNKKKEILRF